MNIEELEKLYGYSKDEINQLLMTVNGDIKAIHEQNGLTTIEFENGKIINLNGSQQKLLNHIEPQCCYCGNIGVKSEPLFTMGENNPYICKNCLMIAFNTFLKNGINIDINLSKTLPDLANNFSKLINQMNNKKQ